MNEPSGMHIAEEFDDAPNLAGLRIKDRYVLLEEIGQGLMARAYLAHDELLEGEVVVKIINTEIAGVKLQLGPEWVQEAKRAMKVRGCPFIASVTDFGEETCELDSKKMNVPFIVWERVYGLTLQQYLEEDNQIDESMIISTLVQLLQVLIALNRGNVIHGDLHVKNVIYDNVTASRHFLKVIDFGLANVVSNDGDFQRDLNGMSRIIGQLLDKFKDQKSDTDKESFVNEVEIIVKQLAEKKTLSSDDLNEYLNRAEELERKFLLGVEWLQSRSKHKPLGYEPEKYLKTVSHTYESPLIGSDDLDDLHGWLKNGLDEEVGRILGIKGEVGLGKSRWSLEILQKLAASDKDLFIMKASAYLDDRTRPFEPVRRLWRSFLGEEAIDNYNEYLNDMFPEIPLIVKPLTDLLVSDAKDSSDSAVMLDEKNYQKLISTGFKHLALKSGLVICIDDINYADDQTLELANDIALASARYPLLLIFTYNNFSRGKFADLMEEFSLRENYISYELSELDKQQTQELIANRYNWKSREDSKKLARFLYPQIGGNPFYINETLKLYEDRRYIVREGEKHKLVKEIDVAENPRSVQALMLERIESFDPDVQMLIRWGAILGISFEIEHLADLMELSTGKVADMLDTLTHDHHLFAKNEDRYTFTPVMLYNTVYSNISEQEKQDMHLKAVDTLKAQVHHDPKLNAAIADHLVRAGKINDEVAEYYLKAANHAFKNNLKLQADEWCDAGINIIEKESTKNDLLMGKFYLLKGVLAKQSGNTQGYRENIYNAYNCAVLSRDKHFEGKALKSLGEYYRSIADYKASIDYYNNSLNIMEELKDSREIALTLKELSINFCFIGKFDEAIEVLGRLREISEELNDREGMARIYNNLGLIYKILGDTQTAKEWLERSITLFREVNDAQGEVLPIGNMAIIYTEEGEFERAMILLREIISSENRLTDTRITAKVHVTLADVLFELGENKEALEYYERALRVFRALGDRQGECEALTNMAFICLEQNKLDLADNYSRLALQIKEEIGYERGIAFNYLISSRVARYSDDLDKARDIVEKSLKLPTLESSNWLRLSFLLEDALICMNSKKIEMAQVRFEEIDLINDELGDKVPKTFKVLFLSHYGRFLISQGDEDTGKQYILESQKILDELERKIFQMKWRKRFRQKYENLLGTDVNIKEPLVV